MLDGDYCIDCNCKCIYCNLFCEDCQAAFEDNAQCPVKYCKYFEGE